MRDTQLLPTSAAAMYLGVSPETLRSWRRRGIGPAFVRLPGGHLPYRGLYWAEKSRGTICYPLDGLREFWERLEVQAGRLPRPIPGRLPKGRRKETGATP